MQWSTGEPSAATCTAGSIAQAAAVQRARVAAELDGFTVDRVLSSELIDYDHIVATEHVPRQAIAECVWYVTMSGLRSSAGDGGPYLGSPTIPTPTPFLFTRMDVGINSVSGQVVLLHSSSAAQDGAATRSETGTSPRAPQPDHKPAP